MGKQVWRYAALTENTLDIQRFCAEKGLKLESLNNGYQLRVNGVIDLYPVRKKWHYLATGQRGEWDDLNDLDMSIFNHHPVYTAATRENMYIANSVDPIVKFNLAPRRRWWQFWKRR